MGEISSFLKLNPLGTLVTLTSVSVKKLILYCRSVLAELVDSSLAVRYLEIQFHTANDEDQHVKVMRSQNARGKQKERISDKFYLQVLVTSLCTKTLTVYFVSNRQCSSICG